MARGRSELPEEEEVDAGDGEEDVMLVAAPPVLVLVSLVVVMVVDTDVVVMVEDADVVVLTPMTVTVVAAAVGGKDSWSAKWTLSKVGNGR